MSGDVVYLVYLFIVLNCVRVVKILKEGLSRKDTKSLKKKAKDMLMNFAG